LSYHVRHTALPRPGSEEKLKRMTGRVFSQALDRRRPLWEIWLVEGLDGGRFALLSKTHHALVDGVSGVDIATVLFDSSPDPMPVSQPDSEWIPRPLPTKAQLLADAVVERGTVPGALGRYLRRNGHPTGDLVLKAMVPVSVRADVERGALGNRVAAMWAPLPVGMTDPVERLLTISHAMQGIKESGQAVGAQVLTGL